MTLFIPEWTRVSARNRPIKRVFRQFDDDVVVRRPMPGKAWVPDLFVQHPSDGWLALTLCDYSYEQIAAGQLFESEEKRAFERLLADFERLDGLAPEANKVLAKRVLMDRCSEQQLAMLTAHYAARSTLILVSREQFLQQGADKIRRWSATMDADAEKLLLQHFFPETGIPAACTARRDFRRNNDASLTAFFLNAKQESAIKFDLEFELPAEQRAGMADFSVRLINGVAGSGKTLIAINRALLLARLSPSSRVLMLSHNTPIIADIKTRLLKAYGKLPANLEIQTFYQWTVSRWHRMLGQWPSLLSSDPLLHLVKSQRKAWPELNLSDDRLQAEFDFINDLMLASEADYLAVDRAGRGFALRAAERVQMWQLYTHVTAVLANNGSCMWSALPGLYLQQLHALQPALPCYQHVLIDEAQFFAPAWFEVVRSACAAGAQLFLCADPNQGFLQRRLSWRTAGLDVVGRTRKLHRSYRTTRSIFQAANQLLQQSVGTPSEEYLQPDYRQMEPGQKPLLMILDSPQDVIDRVVNELVALIDSGQVSLASLLLVHGDGVGRGLLNKALGERIGWHKLWNLNNDKKMPPNGHQRDYLRIAAVETATGLEAGTVFLVGIEALLAGSDGQADSGNEQLVERERLARQLFMAMTRAAYSLTVLVSQRPGLNIEGVFEYQR